MMMPLAPPMRSRPGAVFSRSASRAPASVLLRASLAVGLAAAVACGAGDPGAPPSTAATSTATSVPAVHRLRVMTWNVQRGQAVSGRIAPADMGPFAARVAGSRADVVGLQEVTRAQAESIAGLLGWGTARYVETKSPCPTLQPPLPAACVPFGNAILSRHPTGTPDHWSLPASRLEATLEDRVLLRTVIDVAGRSVFVYVTHLASNATAGEREAQVAAVLALIDTDADDGTADAVVLLGDLNAEPDSDAFALVNNRFVDAWAAVRGSEAGFTSNPTLAVNRRLDYVLVGRGSGLRPVEASVVPEVLSDHLAVVAELALHPA